MGREVKGTARFEENLQVAQRVEQPRMERTNPPYREKLLTPHERRPSTQMVYGEQVGDAERLDTMASAMRAYSICMLSSLNILLACAYSRVTISETGARGCI